MGSFSQPDPNTSTEPQFLNLNLCCPEPRLLATCTWAMRMLQPTAILAGEGGVQRRKVWGGWVGVCQHPSVRTCGKLWTPHSFSALILPTLQRQAWFWTGSNQCARQACTANTQRDRNTPWMRKFLWSCHSDHWLLNNQSRDYKVPWWSSG